jgi:glutamate decarboxylase
VYPGIGWVLWRDDDALPGELVFDVDYLGGDMPTFTLNFSRPGSQVAAQYYTLIRLGFEGFTAVQQTCRDVAMHVAEAIGKMDEFELLSDGSDLPAFAFRLSDSVEAYSPYDVSTHLRQYDWIVPAYKFPKDLDEMHVLRVVVRNGFSRDLADHFLRDLGTTVDWLGRQSAPIHGEEAVGFHH